MNRTDRFDDIVSDWLHADAEHRVPEHLDAVLRRTRSERQRPAWSSLERWLPMQSTLRFAPTPRIAWLLVLIALGIALATAILVVGSRRQVAPPFGTARNGPVAYTMNGDILRFDPATGLTTKLVTGPDQDIAPDYSPDGQRFIFLRQSEGRDVVAIADADGSNLLMLTGPLMDAHPWDWSSDGARLAVTSDIDGRRAITVANTDGSGSHVVPLGDMDADSVSWLGASAERLLFRGRPAGSASAGLFTVKPDGTGRLQVSPDMGDGVGGYQSPRVTSDGRYVSYASFDQGTWRSPTVGSPAHSGGIRRVHVLDLATGQDSAIPIAADPTDPSLPVDQWEPRFSPDGKMLVFQTDRSDGTDQIAVAHTDGSDIPRPLGPSAPTSIDPNDENVSFEFSPDGTKVIARYPAEGVLWALPVDGSPGSTLPWDAVDLPSMQRLAP